MYFLKFVPIFHAALVAAQDNNGDQSVIFTGFNFQGRSRVIPTRGPCINLAPPFRYQVRSIQVADGAHCEIFGGRGCNGMLDDITDSNPQVQEGSQVVSIRCVEFDQ
ncbi:hypothetical protein ACSS6W_002577 [Trichoderma asperelloides]